MKSGPGPGGLTRALLGEGAEKVIAVERDPRCLPALAEIAAAYPGKLEVINADALKLDERAILPPGTRIASNLPYNVGTGLLIKWLTGDSWPPFWSSLTLMFQREVAERIVAKAGQRALWPAVGAGGLADQSENPVRREPQRLRAAALGDLLHRAAGAAAGTGRAGESEKAGSGDRRRFRPAPQDAAPEPEAAGRGSVAGKSRHRPHGAAGTTDRRRSSRPWRTHWNA